MGGGGGGGLQNLCLRAHQLKLNILNGLHYEHDGQRKRTKYTVPHSTLNNCCGRQRDIPSLLLYVCKNVKNR